MDFNESLKTVIQSLVCSFEEEIVEENAKSYRLLQEMYAHDPQNFLETVQMAVGNFHTLVQHVMQVPDTDNGAILEHITSGLYNHFHTERIEKMEGFSCSSDKSSFIEAKTLEAIRKETNLSLFADYQNVEQIKIDKHRKAYWSPTSVKDTDEAMALFWKWYSLKN